MTEQEFIPFYERILGNHVVGKIMLSVGVGFAFLGAYSAIAGPERFGLKRFDDWTWFLALLISVAMLCVFYATDTLRDLLREIDRYLGDDAKAVRAHALLLLTDGKFVTSGIVFGLLNCGFALLFGTPSIAPWTLFVGYFMAGFVCGLAILGIVAVLRISDVFASKTKDTFDFTAPDSCGGISFVGDALTVFAAVTLVVGMMISIYVWQTDWTNQHSWVFVLKAAWLLFPYLCSLVVWIVPAMPFNEALTEYKIREEADLQRRARDTQQQIEKALAVSDAKELREKYQFQQEARKQLHLMRTWPFRTSANLKYCSAIGGNLFAQVSTAIHGHGSGLINSFF